MKHVLPAIALIMLAGCAGANADPLVWTANYAKPYDAMTYCLNANSTDYQTVQALDARQGIGGVLLTSRDSGQKAGEFDVRRLTDTSSQVTFRSAIRTVGGSSYIMDWARRAADSCAR